MKSKNQNIISPKIQQIVQQAKTDQTVLAIAFFGSYAREEEYRDIDVCIFLSSKEYTQLELSQIKFKYTPEDEHYDVQVFQQLPLYIQARILNEAKIIYCKDEDELYDLYFEVEREFEHFKPIYESYLEGVESG
jgi:predicted nucleotidyltransferase